MDENASRAVFLGVSVFVAIITITLILTFYRTAKDSASVANRYDISSTANYRVQEIVGKEEITGLELRYLLNYFADKEEQEVIVYQPDFDKKNGANEEVKIDYDSYWTEETQMYIEEIIRANYYYTLRIEENEKITKIIATFKI